MALFDLLPFNLCLKDYEFSHVEGDLDKSSLKWLCLTRKVNVESKQAYCEAHKAKPQHLQTMNILIMKYKQIVALTSLLVITANVKATPTNEELYGMILDLKKEVSESKTREKDLHETLDKANAELGAAKKQLGALPKTELIVTAVKQLDEIKKDEPPKIPNIKEGFSVSAGALYVKPMTNGYFNSPYSTSSRNDDNQINYVPGFQVSADYQAKNNWDYGLKFKHFQSTTNFNPESYSDAYSSRTYNTQYKINYNVLDLEIGKLLVLSDNTFLRISGGLRTAIMNEKMAGSSSEYYGSYSNYNSNQSLSQDFWGIGPRITADPTWKPFGNNFRVFGNVAGSFLMGQINDSYSYSNSYQSDSSSYKSDASVTILEAGSGLGYTIKTNSADIDLKTGYQVEHWITDGQTNNLNFNGYHGAYGTVAVKY